MPDYAVMYRKLFNGITDVVSNLQQLQKEAEEIYMSSPDPDIRVFRQSDPIDPPTDE